MRPAAPCRCIRIGELQRGHSDPDRLYTDARVTRIYAGTSEVMKVMIAKDLGL